MHNQYISFSAFINEKWCCLRIHGNQMSMENFIINLKHNVQGIALGKNKFFLQFVDFEYDGNIAGPNKLDNNITAYDYNGKELYNIRDIVPYDDAYSTIFIREPVENVNYDFEAIKGHEYLYCYSSRRSIYFIVDITDDKFIAKRDTR